MAARPENAAGDPVPWPARPFLLAGLGLASAIVVDRLLNGYSFMDGAQPVWREALAAAVAVAALVFAFCLERVRLVWTAAFALVEGAVVGLILYWSGTLDSTQWSWAPACLALAVAVTVPLFQVARDEGRWRLPYDEVHGRAWTNAVLWFACWAFAGVALGLAWLLAALFSLIKITILSDLLSHSWADFGLLGSAFGGALGLLRERETVVRLLQRVVTLVLGTLAPVLGAGLVLFLIALPFTGLTGLWATRNATSVLLSCVIGALILANAVIGRSEEEVSGAHVVLRWGAAVLAAAMLPLTVIAAVATGLRIDQHGLTPQRLWALVLIAIASAYAVAYLADLVIGRRVWKRRVRLSNLRLAMATAVIGVFLATPLFGFNQIAADDQVARLQSGRVSPDKFDWAALRFDSGAPGRAAVKELTRSTNPEIASRAKGALDREQRYEVNDAVDRQSARKTLPRRVRVLPAAVALPPPLLDTISRRGTCSGDAQRCVVLYTDGAAEAWVMPDDCFGAAETGAAPGTQRLFQCSTDHLVLANGAWVEREDNLYWRDVPSGTADKVREAFRQGKVAVRTVPRRQIFVGDEPVGQPFE